MDALVQLEKVSDSFTGEARMSDNTNVASPVVQELFPESKDYFVERNGVRFAGVHLIVDLWGASRLDDPAHIDAVLREGALTSGATILHGHFHHFSPNGGVSGVLVLAESHVSIHTWPERDYAAIDIFMCGECDPYKAIAALKKGFGPDRVQLAEHKRGMVG